jgi:hypothetical protein
LANKPKGKARRKKNAAIVPMIIRMTTDLISKFGSHVNRR